MFFFLCFVPVANMELKCQHMLSHMEIIYCFPGPLPLDIRGFLQVLKLKWQTFTFTPINGHLIFICNLPWRSNQFPLLEITWMNQQRNKNYMAKENFETFCIHWASLTDIHITFTQWNEWFLEAFMKIYPEWRKIRSIPWTSSFFVHDRSKKIYYTTVFPSRCMNLQIGRCHTSRSFHKLTTN